MKSRITVISLMSLFVFSISGIIYLDRADAGSKQDDLAVVSQYVTEAPTLDGIAEAAWDGVPAITVSAFGGANGGSHTINLKSVYTDDEVHFLVQWTDATFSQRRFPWVKQEDGSWLQLNDGSDHDENSFYEDKFAFIWNVNNTIVGFNEGAGCFATCHAGEANKAYGNKYNQNAGEVGDIWHWKSVRSGPEGYVDDQYLDDARWSEDNGGAGRHSDPRDSGSYVNNVNEAGDAPAFMSPAGAAGNYWILDSEKVEFADTFEVGDEIAGIVVQRPTGDRGDIVAQAVYADGSWTLEMSRKLVTGSEFDVQFDDLQQAYFFGMAVFDNAQVRHSFQAGVSKMEFAPKPTAVAGQSWGEIKGEFVR
jgi:hypothetical protein